MDVRPATGPSAATSAAARKASEMAEKRIVALYESTVDAERIRGDLVQSGLATARVELLKDDGGDVGARLRGYGVPERDAGVYAEGVRRGGSLVTGQVDERELNQALA